MGQKANANELYLVHLDRFTDKIVKVKEASGDEFNGKCIAVSAPYMNIILKKTDGKIVAIRNVAHIEEA